MKELIELDEIIALDKSLLLQWNGSDSLFLDGFMWMYSTTWLWIPLAIMFFVVVLRNNKMRDSILIFLLLALLIAVADRFSSGFCKPFFQRFRPTHDPEISSLVHVVNNYRGGMYGFISSHTANTFAVFSFTALLFKNYTYTFFILLWALISSYSRVYLGVHYFGDVLFGMLSGVVIGSLFYWLYLSASALFVGKNQRNAGRMHRYSSGGATRSGYAVNQVHDLVSVFVLLNILAMLFGTIYMNS